MNLLKNALISPPFVKLFNTTGPSRLNTNACVVQKGCVLPQQQPEGTTEPKRFLCRPLTHAKHRYNTTQREYLVIVWAVFLLHCYLRGRRSTIRADHDSLEWILNLTNNTGRLAHWLLRLYEVYFDVTGVIHQAVAALSHLLETGEDGTLLEDNLPLLAIDAERDHSSIPITNTNSNDIILLNAKKIKHLVQLHCW